MVTVIRYCEFLQKANHFQTIFTFLLGAVKH